MSATYAKRSARSRSVPGRAGSGDMERGKHSYQAPKAARSTSTSIGSGCASVPAPVRSGWRAMMRAISGASAASLRAASSPDPASRSARAASHAVSLPSACAAAVRMRAAPSSSSLATSSPASPLRASPRCQVAKRSTHASTVNSCRASVSTTKLAVQRSLPSASIATSCHAGSPARRQRTRAASRSCPSAVIVAPTATDSPSARFAAKRPPSTCGDTSSMTTRLGGPPPAPAARTPRAAAGSSRERLGWPPMREGAYQPSSLEGTPVRDRGMSSVAAPRPTCQSGAMRTTGEQEAEIAAAREARHGTRRPTVPALEEVLFEVRPVLDHGFIRVIDYMGDDAAIVQAARVSYGRGTKRVSEDRGLIRYLMRHHHTTPFEMCELKLHCKLPIFVARQWIRHRTANVNEASGRYSILDREFYMPAEDVLGVQSAANRQGRAETLVGEHAARVLDLLKADAARCYDHYQELLNEDDAGQPLRAGAPGLARELARINLPVSLYTQWYWKIDLHNLFHFLMLRADPHAQEEIRAYALAIGDVVERWVPNAWEAFVDFRLEAMMLSRGEREAVRRLLAGERVDLAALGLSKREQDELRAKLGVTATER